MKFVDEVSKEKLRGGFYTPIRLVSECYRRLGEILGSNRQLHILEPSAGDGAFIRGVEQAVSEGSLKSPTFLCIELIDKEARKCCEELRRCCVEGAVVNESFFAWARGKLPVFDAVVGNPPFVRYQFVPKDQRKDADHFFTSRGKRFDGVSNMWIPFFLISLELIREDGAFSCVLPSELLATKSTGIVRSELIRHFTDLRIDFFQRGLFPSILQDTILVSGVKCGTPAENRSVSFVEHGLEGERYWSHGVDDSKDAWTKYLLSQRQLTAYESSSRLQEMHRIGEVANIGVSIVTGANDFFTVDDETIAKYDLSAWAKPLLARTTDSLGIVFRKSDHNRAKNSGRKAWILDFSAGSSDPMNYSGARKYLSIGESQSLPARYKCRIRTPWYRVPDVRQDYLMMSKRAHQYHRLLLNRAKAHTTDTIYRGRMRPLFDRWKESIVAGFHNSLTILSSEIEGRTYGGGVIELIPSELARLVIPLVEMGEHLNALDKICRDAGGQRDTHDTLIHATNELLCKQLPKLQSLIPDLESAREHLRRRRFFG